MKITKKKPDELKKENTDYLQRFLALQTILLTQKYNNVGSLSNF